MDDDDPKQDIPCSRQVPSKVNENVHLPPAPCSVICSSSCKNMNSNSSYTQYRLFKSNIRGPVAWPDKTDTCCWWCCHTFETTPVCIPAYYCSVSKHFEVFGIFCSWNCAKASVQQNYSSESAEQLMWMRIMAKKVFGTDLGEFNAAPPRIFLKMFGGHLDIDTFREKSVSSRTVMLSPPLVSYPIVQQEVHPKPKEEPASDTVHDILSTMHPSMLAGKVVGLRRPQKAQARQIKDRQHSTGMYKKYMEKQSDEKPNKALPARPPSGSTSRQAAMRNKGTLANFIRSRAPT